MVNSNHYVTEVAKQSPSVSFQLCVWKNFHYRPKTAAMFVTKMDNTEPAWPTDYSIEMCYLHL